MKHKLNITISFRNFKIFRILFMKVYVYLGIVVLLGIILILGLSLLDLFIIFIFPYKSLCNYISRQVCVLMTCVRYWHDWLWRIGISQCFSVPRFLSFLFFSFSVSTSILVLLRITNQRRELNQYEITSRYIRNSIGLTITVSSIYHSRSR